MKKIWIGLLTASLIIFGLISCQSNGTTQGNNTDTAIRTSSDTTVIPGTPGPAGTEPKPNDTTHTNKDSLNSMDSSGGSKPAEK